MKIYLQKVINLQASIRKLCFIFLFALLAAQTSFSQLQNYNVEKEFWIEGRLQHSSGKQLAGDINYNFVTDQVKVKSGSEAKNYIPNNVVSFQLYDSMGTVEFHSIDYDFIGKGRPIRAFFRKEYQNDQYMILSKNVVKYKTGDYIGGLNRVSAGVSIGNEVVTRLIFLADRSGRVVQCLEGKIDKETTIRGIAVGYGTNPLSYPGFEEDYSLKKTESNSSKQLKKYKKLNNFPFREFFGADYKKFKSYVEEQNLDVRSLRDLALALNF